MKGREEKRGPCISGDQLENHIRQQYTQQSLKLREIEARLTKAENFSADPTYCQLRSLKKEFSYSANSVRLHRYYFDSIRCPAPGRTTLVVSLLSRDFGSWEEWEDQFTALGLCARGWVVAGFDLREGRIHNYISDSHAEGVWAAIPLLVLDVYEHAYCREFQSRREYVRSFLDSVDWEMVDRRARAAVEASKLCRGLF